MTTQQHITLWYKEYKPWLVTWLCKQVACQSRAQDLCHDTFVRLLRKTNLEAPTQPRAYLTRIAHGLMVDHWRRQDIEKNYLAQLSQLDEAQSLTLEQQQAVLETLYQIDKMLETLPLKVKNVFLMSRLDNMKNKEIATSLSISLSSVEKYLKIALLHCYQIRFGE